MGAIISGSKYDLVVSRLCSLWFLYRRNSRINEIMSKAIIPLYKMVPLVYQLAARLDATEGQPDIFQAELQRLVHRLLIAHPHHVLYQLLSLRASASPTAAGSKRKLVAVEGSRERRAQAAANLIAKAKSSSDPLMLTIISDTERLWQAYSELATIDLPPETAPKHLHPFDERWGIKKIKDLCCPVPTALQDPTDLITVKGFADGFKVVGGINLPKIIECIGSDGKRYRQLVKGKDDVRQV